MAYQQGSLQQMLAMHQQNEDAKQQDAGNAYLQSLLSQGSESGGQFDIVEGNPIYDTGMDLPKKSEAWNAYVSSKGGRITSADIQMFEQSYKGAKGNKVKKQLQELDKLRAKGFSDYKIQESVRDNKVLYENLLDLTTELSGSGDPAALEQAMMLQQYLPQQDRGGVFFGGETDPRVADKSKIILGATALAGKYAFDKFGNPTKLTADQKKDYHKKLQDAKRPNTEARIKAENEIKDNKKTLKTKSKEIKDKANKLRQPNKSKPLQKMIAEENELKKKNRKLNKDIKGYRDANKNIAKGNVVPKPESLVGRNKYKFKGGPAPLTSIVASIMGPELGKGIGGFVGGDKGAEIGEFTTGAAIDAGLFGSGLLQLLASKGKKGWSQAGIGGYGLGSRAYNYFTGQE